MLLARWHREDRLDLAHVGEKTDTATHGAKDGITDAEAQAVTTALGPHAQSLDNLVDTGEDRWRYGEAERLGGL
jgi:hypothetical protein